MNRKDGDEDEVIETYFFVHISLPKFAKIKKTSERGSCNVCCLTLERDSVPAEMSCFQDYGQELALSLLCCFEIGRNHRQKFSQQ